jgi:hypothetical protein
MMGSFAFLMPFASIRLMRFDAYSLRARARTYSRRSAQCHYRGLRRKITAA